MCIKTEEKALPLVNLQIVGVQKAGTSALAHFLSKHPDVCVVEGKEAHVFDQPDFCLSPDKFAFAQRRYAKKLHHYAGQKVICDATPITLLNVSYLQACYDYNPKAKMIVLLREPVSRAVSHYKMMWQLQRESKNMLMAFVLEKYRLRHEQADAQWERESPWRHRSYLQRGRYSKQLAQLYAMVPKEQILILNQEDLLTKHDETLVRVLSFLELPLHDIPSETIFASPKSPVTLTERIAKMYATLYYKLDSIIFG